MSSFHTDIICILKNHIEALLYIMHRETLIVIEHSQITSLLLSNLYESIQLITLRLVS